MAPFPLRPTVDPFTRHALGLVVVLLVVMPVAGTDAVWSADVGAQLFQAQVLLDGAGWIQLHPLPQADPDGIFYPLHLAQLTPSGGYVALAKHPLLTWLVAGLLNVGGLPAVILSSTLSTAAASLAAARLAELIRPGSAIPALWFTGLLTPLFFDGYLGYSHSLAAALVGWAALAGVRAVETASPAGWAGLVLAIGGATVVRTEAAIAGLALAAGLATAATVDRSHRRWLMAALVTATATGCAAIVDRVAAIETVGRANPSWNDVDVGYLEGRLLALHQTWLNPGPRRADVLLLVAATLVMSAGWLTRRRRPGPVAAALGLALLAVVARAALDGPVIAFGLIVACPLLMVGLIGLTRSQWNQPLPRMLLVAFGLYCAGVILTQHPYGGVAEWGGRYFAAGVPLCAPLAVVGLGSLTRSLDPRSRSSVMALAMAGALTINLVGIWHLGQVRRSTAALVSEIALAQRPVGTGSNQSGVVITTAPQVGRQAWDLVGTGRWLLVDRDALAETGRRLDRLAIDSFTLITFQADAELRELTPWYEVGHWNRTDRVPGEVIVMCRRAVQPGAGPNCPVTGT